MAKYLLSGCLFILISCSMPRSGAAQTNPDCSQELADANQQYARGRFDETIVLLDQCLDKEGIPEEDRLTAYRLKGLSFIGKGLEGDARSSVRRLLALVPSYEPDPDFDPPDFVSLINEIKQEMNLNEPQVGGQSQPESQTQATPPPTESVTASEGPERGGFTFLLSIGLGLQNDEALEDNAIGLSGLNVGLGGFVSDQLAILLRISGTTASYSFDEFGFDPNFQLTQVSGVLAVTGQYWVNDTVYLEGGPGLAFFDFDSGDATDQAFGLLLGGGFTVFNKRKSNVQLGIEYAPGFFDVGTIHNIGFNLGFQLL